ncbi:MAG TPA: hypothetical protein DCX54_01395 [Flavobacteriales bacterium]|nr:hypothetical protein [Flavobacteriales bacterium]
MLILAFVIPILSFDYGVTWDEPLSMQYSADMLRYFATWGKDKTCLDETIPLYNHMIYYGNVFGLMSTLLHKILPFDIIQTRHLLNSIFGYLSIFYIVRHARLISDYKLAFLTLLLLVLSPRFFGYIMNMFRDTTLMLGFVGSTYYFHRILVKLPSFSIHLTLKAALFVFLASSVRIGGMILLPIFALLLVYYFVDNRKNLAFKPFLSASGAIVIISALSYSLTVSIWPWAHQSPFTRPLEAALAFSDLQLMLNYQLFEGVLIPNRNVPWNYLFTWLGVTTPLIVLIGLLLFTLVLGKSNGIRRKELFIPLVAIGLPLLFYLFRLRNLYDGWRHFLFLMPFLALFSAIGWKWLISLFDTPKIQKSIVGVMAMLFVFPVNAMVHYHPVQNTYFNELIGGIKGAFGEFEIDMDGNSLRPATEWFNKYCVENKLSEITLASNHGGMSISQYFNPLLIKGNIVWLSLGQTYLKNWDYAILTSRTLSKFELNRGQWPPKGTIYSFEIDGIAIASVVKREDKSIQVGTNALKKRNFEVALDNFLRAREKYPDMELPHRMLGMTYMQMEKYDLAEKSFDKALSLNPPNVFLLHYIGELSYYQGNFEKALSYLSKSLEMRIDNYRSEYLIANIYIRSGKFDEARKLYEKLLLRKPLASNNRSLILNGFGEYYVVMALRDNENKRTLMNKAIELFEESINTNNKNQMAYQNLIDLYVHIGREDYAEQTRQIMIKNCGVQSAKNE